MLKLAEIPLTIPPEAEPREGIARRVKEGE